MPAEYTTFGAYIVNDVLPDGYKIDQAATKNVLLATMSRLAKEKPEVYKEVILEMKELGDKIATYDGISVGLDDIEPDYAARKPIIDAAKEGLKKAKNDDERLSVLIDAQGKIGDLAMKHKGTMAMMARAGGRGNKGQLMKSVATPVIVADQKGHGIPFLIENSYAEGLTPAEYWIAANEARQNVITGQLATAEPGAQGKILTNLGADLVIAAEDCGTENGLAFEVDSGEIIDRYSADNPNISWLEKNTLIDAEMQRKFIEDKVEKVTLRSPMTCELREGVCQFCQGLDEKGNLHDIGTNVGIRAAQALSEPLTQLALSAKHGLRLAKKDSGPTGLRAFVQYMESPKTFPHKAPVAPADGYVTSVTKAPQGGHYVTVAGKKTYIPVGLDVLVKEGQKVEAGDALSEGIVYPPDVVKYKGLGAGRDYLVDSVYNNVYSGRTDRRHLELLMKRHLNYVRIEEDDNEDTEFLPGEVVDYNTLQKHYKDHLTVRDLSEDLLGEHLAKDVLHYTVGTKITQRVLSDMKSAGVKQVSITTKKPKFTPVVAPMSRVPLYNSDWMQRLNHRYLKSTLLQAAHYGESSDLHSLNPMPAYAYGAEFGAGTGPEY